MTVLEVNIGNDETLLSCILQQCGVACSQMPPATNRDVSPADLQQAIQVQLPSRAVFASFSVLADSVRITRFATKCG